MKAILKALKHEAEALEERARNLLTGASAARELIEAAAKIEAGTEKPAKTKKTGEKAPRGSTTRRRKKSRKGRAWTQEQKDKAAATRAKRKAAATAEKAPAAAPAAVSAHEALQQQSEREVSAASNGPGRHAGSLAGLKLAPAIRQVLSKAARPLTSTEIMDRLKVGGFKHTAAGPLVNSVTGTLSGMGLSYERRAGRNFYAPITEGGDQ